MPVGREHWPVLALNADYRPLSYLPLSLWSWQEAIKAVFNDRVDIVAEYEETVRSPSVTMRLPSVIALRDYRPQQSRPAFTRYNIFLRDDFRCNFCGTRHGPGRLTVDHVVPRSRGGTTIWHNVVAACGQCNTRKGNKLPHEAAMTMRIRPFAPSLGQLQAKARRFPPRFIHSSWQSFLEYELLEAAE